MPRFQPYPVQPRTALGRAFWGAGVAGSVVLALPIALGLQGWPPAVLAGAMLLFVVYTAWAMRLVWRSAGHASNPVLGLIARMLTVAWTINVLLLSVFLVLSRVPTG